MKDGAMIYLSRNWFRVTLRLILCACSSVVLRTDCLVTVKTLDLSRDMLAYSGASSLE